MGAVRASMIVEGDPRADPLACFSPAREGMQVDALVFERTPEPLDEDVVEEPTASVHRDPYASLFQSSGPGPGGELATLIGVEDLRRAVAFQGFVQRIKALLETPAMIFVEERP